MEESIPRATESSGSPSEFAISETPVLSGVCSNEANIDSDILHSFVLHPTLAETQTPFVVEDEVRFAGTEFIVLGALPGNSKVRLILNRNFSLRHLLTVEKP